MIDRSFLFAIVLVVENSGVRKKGSLDRSELALKRHKFSDVFSDRYS